MGKQAHVSCSSVLVRPWTVPILKDGNTGFPLFSFPAPFYACRGPGGPESEGGKRLGLSWMNFKIPEQSVGQLGVGAREGVSSFASLNLILRSEVLSPNSGLSLLPNGRCLLLQPEPQFPMEKTKMLVLATQDVLSQ